jgi:hypothetical protein
MGKKGAYNLFESYVASGLATQSNDVGKYTTQTHLPSSYIIIVRYEFYSVA